MNDEMTFVKTYYPHTRESLDQVLSQNRLWIFFCHLKKKDLYNFLLKEDLSYVYNIFLMLNCLYYNSFYNIIYFNYMTILYNRIHL